MPPTSTVYPARPAAAAAAASAASLAVAAAARCAAVALVAMAGAAGAASAVCQASGGEPAEMLVQFPAASHHQNPLTVPRTQIAFGQNPPLPLTCVMLRTRSSCALAYRGEYTTRWSTAPLLSRSWCALKTIVSPTLTALILFLLFCVPPFFPFDYIRIPFFFGARQVQKK
jgi:hypothetical protein